MKIYIVGFDPINNEQGGVGGFDWYYDKEVAKLELIKHTDIGEDFIWYRECSLNSDMSNCDITEHIEHMLSEFGSDGDW